MGKSFLEDAVTMAISLIMPHSRTDPERDRFSRTWRVPTCLLGRNTYVTFDDPPASRPRRLHHWYLGCLALARKRLVRSVKSLFSCYRPGDGCSCACCSCRQCPENGTECGDCLFSEGSWRSSDGYF